ncbi:MAG: hypothetical protein AUJ37_01280 [Candidatus Magasanikbacteria bacterium CG1_02_41_34]|nr:MAG: hypothetical protein AUJ37_01280 [Candidatus Magasanikbacteria bacterium CG1_02_41_34]
MRIYKHAPRIFLLFKFGVGKNKNTQSYWSGVHASEGHLGETQHSRFGNSVSSLLDRIDFTDRDVLDVGCARGTFLESIPEAKSRTGVDISHAAVAEVQKKGMMAWQVTLPYLYLKKQFDIVTCFETLEHVLKWQETIIQLVRHTRDNGYVIISVPFEDSIVIDEHVVYFDVSRIYKEMRKHLTVVEMRILGPWILVVGQKKKYVRGQVYDAYPELL